ncbi:ATP-dependent helicase HrpB [Sulfurimonas sp. SAG-AH-194-L11]|nr:ATP-dependent helicase HrpB [Sulfurimonas sp. SAG-AH-194-L11]MDF1877437.1 ATP-dependent helicase HrpB [Sulfurimonas sp. SAG-AH-194-L11]
MQKLPIEAVLADVTDKLQKNSTLILQAPPGAGKSTRVPLALMNEPYLNDKIIIMLEPRRVAARMVATQMARVLGEEVGKRVGYQVKMDSAQSKETKVLVVTEAILVRMLQADEMLERVGMIIFDEFHERSIHSDLSLALSLQVQELLREDLKILIMSATLNASALVELLGNVPVVTSEGKSYDVAMHYLDIKTPALTLKTMNTQLVKTINYALQNDEGDILVFLQGVKEIRNLQKSLGDVIKNDDILVCPLYSALNKKEQDKALQKSNRRKIILATNIAQTSLTIEGVRIVVDTGLEKLSRFNYANAMNHLDSSFISKDSSVQRAGRAGRMSDGKCYRLWHESKVLMQSTKAEILRSDLSSLVLDLSLWGVTAFDELKWLDIPQTTVLQETRETLTTLEMLDSKHKITAFGRDAIKLGVHPRFAYMILKANTFGYTREATLLCAMLGERDVFRNARDESDLLARFTHLNEKDFDSAYIDSFVAREVIKQADFIFTKLKKMHKVVKKEQTYDSDMMAVLLLLAYPDRLAKRRVKNDNRYKLSNAKGAILSVEDALFNEEYLVVANLHANAKDSFINLAMALELKTIEEYFSHTIKIKEQLLYNKESKKFDLRESTHFLDLELYSKPQALSAKYDMKGLLLELIKQEGLELLSWSKRAKSLQKRVAFVNLHSKEPMESLSDEVLLNSLGIWLEPFMADVKSPKMLETLDIYPMLLSLLSWENQQELSTLAPEKVSVPSGSNITIDYSDISKPALHVKLQEMFGLEDTPKIFNSNIALQIQLLSPAMRPIQITYDLSSFWKNSYAEVRKEMRGKYKRHYWPENPYEAVATKQTKKHMMKKSDNN